jgi:tetratricopeptide (TPR) repeat protein
MRFVILLALGTLLAPVVARAEWLEASSAHFVVYADDSEKDILRFSRQLERFHSAMGVITRVRSDAPSPSNRVTVYVVRNEAEVRRLYGGKDRLLSAFYLPRPGGSLAIVPRVTTGTTQLDFSMIALLHEYAHHFMFASSTGSMPRWYSEGAAEFFASASFYADGSVGIGQPANHRAWELFQERDVPVTQLLDTQDAGKRRSGGADAFYGKSWLLFHYLTFSQERRGQLARYLQLMGQGRSSKDAGAEAFGEPKQLEQELATYKQRRTILSLKLPADRLESGEVTLRRLRVGEAAAMPVQIRSRRGVDAKLASEILPEARALAARFPEDAAVLSVLAEAENDAGNAAEAIAAADAAIARDPRLANPYIQKGLSLFSLATKASDPASAFAAARAPFIALNKLENDHPLPLIYNYLSFTLRQKTPTDNAVNGLRRAVELAPFDQPLRMMLATELVRRREPVEARGNLQAVAYSPHGGRLAAAAQRVLDHMDTHPDWDGQDVTAVINDGKADEPEAEGAR